MKKNFVKKLAVALSLAMAVTTIAPANYASAAAAPTFKSASVKVKVGATKKYSTANSSKYSVKFKVGNKSVATIKYSAGSKSVKVTGVAEGKTTLRADFKSYKTKKTTTVKVPVTVVPNETTIKSVAQTTTKKLAATFSADVTDIKAGDLAIVRDSDSVVVAIKSVTVDSADKTKATIETYTDMADGKTYTVTFKEKSKAQFTATDATVADVALDTYVVTAGKAEPVKVQTLDAKGVILGSYDYSKVGEHNLECTIDTNDGYIDGDKLFLSEVGKTAKVKVVYHTWKYDEAGNETGKIEKEFTVSAVKDATTVSNFTYTIAKTQPSWKSSSFKANTQLSASDKNMNVYFLIKDSNGNEVDYAAYGYTLASSDTTKLIVAETAIAGNATPVPVVGVAAGTAYILLKDKDGNTVKTFPVTVLADRKATTLLVDQSTVTMSNVPEAADNKEIKLTLKDQFGEEMDIEDVAEVECLSTSGKNALTKAGAEAAFAQTAQVAGKVKFTAEDYMAGTYTFKVTVKGVSRTITAVVKTSTSPAKASSYELKIDGVDASKTVDVAVASDAANYAAASKDITLKVAKKDAAGVVYDYVGTVAYTVKNASGKEVANAAGVVALSTTNASGTAIKLASNVAAGTYNVTATFTNDEGKEATLKTTFTVKDSQTLPTIDVKETKASSADIKEVLAPSENVVYYYDGETYKNGELTVVSVDAKSVSDGGDVFVKSVTVIVPISANVSRELTISVNKTFTNVK